MLHNILLKANEWNSISKQGKYLNVVLAAGDISARITLLNNSTFETKLVSGMAFPIPDGFQSVAFLSETSQQTKIWLGDLPLTYTPNELITVGSKSMQSTQKELVYGELTTLLPARVGRGKATLQADKDFYLGGTGSSVGSAIKISAGTLFEFSTQGAVFGYSIDQNDTPHYFNNVDLPLSELPVKTVLSEVSHLVYNPVSTRMIYQRQGYLYHANKDDFSGETLITNPLNGSMISSQDIIIEEDGFTLFGFDDVRLTKVKFLFDDYSYVATEIANTPANAGAYNIDIKGNEFVLAASNMKLWRGSLDGGNYAEISLVTYPAIATANHIRFLANGDLIAFQQSTGDYAITSDDGVNWSQHQLLSYSGMAPKQASLDPVTGFLYMPSAGTFDLVVSKDNGVSWSNVSIPAEIGGVINVEAIAGRLYIASNNYFAFGNDGDWTVYYLDDNNATNPKPHIVNDGTTYVYNGGTINYLYAFGGVRGTAGGMKVNVLEEIS